MTIKNRSFKKGMAVKDFSHSSLHTTNDPSHTSNGLTVYTECICNREERKKEDDDDNEDNDITIIVLSSLSSSSFLFSLSLL